jgi:BASS family bile acid:Na+ symporter
MSDRNSLAGALSHWVHGHFLWLLLGSYAAAAASPAFGLWIRDVCLGQVVLFGETARVTLPMLMLALLLANAGLGVQPSRLWNLRGGAGLLLAGLAANLLVPLAFLLGLAQALRLWHNPEEAQQILTGLALVASMPIAGSSTAWAQNSDGNMALSLGLVLASILLSPLTTPVALHAVARAASGDYAEHLRGLAASGAGVFLAACVVLPSVLGVLARWAAGEARVAAAGPGLRLANNVNLLVLIYANASASLPEAVAYPDADFLALTLGVVAALCVLCFASGWWVARLLRADPAQRASLTFGLGMNNNGTGLVLASVALAGHPRVLLPIILYNLVQHLVAGGAALALGRARAGEGREADAPAAEGRGGTTGVEPSG